MIPGYYPTVGETVELVAAESLQASGETLLKDKRISLDRETSLIPTCRFL